MTEPNWEKAAVFTALAIFLTPLLYTTTHTLFHSLKTRLRRAPPPPLHNPTPHAAAPRCWERDTGLAVVFNRAWKVARAQDARRVPGSLPLGCSYVCTDARTVLAFVLATAPAKKAEGNWNAAAGVYGGTKLACVNSRAGVVVCHVQGGFQKMRADLTRREFERLLEGYPPWYRDHFSTWGGVRLSFPITSLHDVSRGGWIVAVGLMSWDVAGQVPLALYRCEDEPGEPEWRGNGVVYRRAVRRCLEHVTRNTLALFPQDVNVNAAVTMLNYLLTQGTASGMQCPGQFKESWKTSGSIPNLRSSECGFLLKSFNGFQPLDVANGERDKLEGFLLPAMAAVVHGAVEVVEYLKDVGVEFKFPNELADFDREVWLRDCVSVPVFE